MNIFSLDFVTDYENLFKQILIKFFFIHWLSYVMDKANKFICRLFVFQDKHIHSEPKTEKSMGFNQMK